MEDLSIVAGFMTMPDGDIAVQHYVATRIHGGESPIEAHSSTLFFMMRRGVQKYKAIQDAWWRNPLAKIARQIVREAKRDRS